MSAQKLSDRPSLEFYKKQAKDLVKAFRAGDREAAERAQQHHPRFERRAVVADDIAQLTLADAQLVIAREHGCDSWPKFAEQVRVRSGKTNLGAIWKTAERAVIAGDVETLERLLNERGDLLREQEPPPYTPSGPR